MTDLSKYDNSWYVPGGSALKRILWYFANVIFIKSHLNPVSSLKCRVLRLFGAEVGHGVVIKPGVNIKYPWRLTIGDFSWIGEDVWIDNLAQVSIGPNCCVSQGAMLLCGNHNYKQPGFDLIVRPITLEEGSWVGAKSVVCPGVTLSEGAILAAGSVAATDLEAGFIYQGNPAAKKRSRM